MIQLRFGTLFVCEIKFSRRKIGMSIIAEMQHRLEHLRLPKRISYRPVLIHVNGVTDELRDSRYFAEIIDFGDFLKSV